MDLSTPATLHLPQRIEVGSGTAALLGAWAKDYKRILIIPSRSTRGMLDRLALTGDIALAPDVPAEPKDSDFDAALDAARSHRPDLIVGLGGGSVMDVAKLVAVLWNSDQSLVEVVGPNKVTQKCSALAQVATTAGTGSEGGIRALVSSTETGAKMAVESPHMAADIAILDPDLTFSVPRALTAETGVDALAHSVEAFTNINAHPLVDGYARLGIGLAGQHLVAASTDGENAEARAGMLLSSFYGGLCLGPVNTAAGHALAYPLGTRLGLGHGLAVSLLFPHVLAFNAAVQPDKTAEILSALGLIEGDIATATRDWCASLGLTMSLAAHGATEADLRPWAEEAHAIRRLMNNNPREMSVDDVEAIYRAAF